MSETTHQQDHSGTDGQGSAEASQTRTDQDTRTGAIGGDESKSADTPIGLPAKDGSPLGDTDQHSSAATAPGHPRK